MSNNNTDYDNELDDIELETLRDFYECWREFHKISNTKGSSDKSVNAAIQLLVTAAHAVDTAQQPRIILLDC